MLAGQTGADTGGTCHSYLHVYEWADRPMCRTGSMRGQGGVEMVTDPVDFFDRIGQTQWHRDLQRTLIYWLGIRQDDELLEVGCATGRFTMQLAHLTESVTGVDVSAKMVERARFVAKGYRLHNAAFAVGNIVELPFSDGKFDKTLCLNLMFMFANPVQPLAEVLRVTKQDGQAVILDPSSEMNPWSAQTYCHHHGLIDFDRDSLLSLATAMARYDGLHCQRAGDVAESVGGEVLERVPMLEGLMEITRIRKR
ncbi:methyltransferase domain-containing protein [Alicyclobacillaceae bacterium I2511]|nr:methyltransferase domain-containing protein [Alicyclobacillaceae bacterium I2511]